MYSKLHLCERESMRKSVSAISLSTLSLSARSSSGDGSEAITEERDTPEFSAVALDGVSTVRIHKGPQAIRLSIDG